MPIPFKSQGTVSRTLHKGQRCITFTIKAISEMPLIQTAITVSWFALQGVSLYILFKWLSDFSVLICPYEWKQPNTSAMTVVIWHQLIWKPCFSTFAFISAKNMTFPFKCLVQAIGKNSDGYSVWSRWLLLCNVNSCVLPSALISVLSMHSIFGSFSWAYCLHATSPIYAICGNPSFDAFLFFQRMGLFCTLPFSTGTL